MNLEHRDVGLLRCAGYDRSELKGLIDRLCASVSFALRPGETILLKPNLLGALRRDGLACTHPEFVAAAAEWCLDHSVRVVIGDSPAFGTGKGVMKAIGLTDALKGLPVRLVNFEQGRQVLLPSGIVVRLAAEAFECDRLVNLPKVKAHGQLLVTLAIKNFFGTVVGMRKAWYHVRYGDNVERFTGLLVDLLEVMPAGVTLADAVVAMQTDGPVHGKPFPLAVVAAAVNPVALETALTDILGLHPSINPLWRECARRHLTGTNPADISYPLLPPEAVRVDDFCLPRKLKPISFNPCRMACSAVKRFISR
jgi:uncharacterized protein (DUF362 family)